uniref:Uncharacterized protein n=1 Tax=viral metagenome TaxID=1070528 RepID=A0A6C0I683_9ZZZZ
MIANPKDLTLAMALLALAVVPLLVGMPSTILNITETSPLLVKGVWVLVIMGLLYQHLTLTALVLISLGLIVRYEVFGSYVFSHDGILAEYAAAQKKDPRFDKNRNVDLLMAENKLVSDPARWLDPGRKKGPLLLYPPTPEQLSLIGNNGH